ncbi:hypothetical protein KQI84_07895, partial [bacterium]|nr:hypothetical protein [bacterium]
SALHRRKHFQACASQDGYVLLNAGGPKLELTPDTMNFGDVELGSGPATVFAILTSTGYMDLETSTTLVDDGSGTFSIASLPATPLANSTSTTLEIDFEPAGLGLVTGSITMETNTTSGTLTIALSGTGVDTTPPTSSADALSGPINTAVFDIAWSGSDTIGGSGLADVELFYQRDGSGYVSYGTVVGSPVSFDTAGTGGDGTYEFYTIATDNATNVEAAPVSADASIVVDTQAPSSQVTAPSGSLVQPSAVFDVEWTGDDGTGTGIDHVELFYQKDGARAFVSYGTFASSPISFDTTGTGGSGTYEFYVVGTDIAGNTESAPATADVTVNFNDVTGVAEWQILNH